MRLNVYVSISMPWSKTWSVNITTINNSNIISVNNHHANPLSIVFSKNVFSRSTFYNSFFCDINVKKFYFAQIYLFCIVTKLRHIRTTIILISTGIRIADQPWCHKYNWNLIIVAEQSEREIDSSQIQSNIQIPLRAQRIHAIIAPNMIYSTQYNKKKKKHIPIPHRKNLSNTFYPIWNLLNTAINIITIGRIFKSIRINCNK